jgi:hypothetical protein
MNNEENMKDFNVKEKVKHLIEKNFENVDKHCYSLAEKAFEDSSSGEVCRFVFELVKVDQEEERVYHTVLNKNKNETSNFSITNKKYKSPQNKKVEIEILLDDGSIDSKLSVTRFSEWLTCCFIEAVEELGIIYRPSIVESGEFKGLNLHSNGLSNFMNEGERLSDEIFRLTESNKKILMQNLIPKYISRIPCVYDSEIKDNRSITVMDLIHWFKAIQSLGSEKCEAYYQCFKELAKADEIEEVFIGNFEEMETHVEESYKYTSWYGQIPDFVKDAIDWGDVAQDLVSRERYYEYNGIYFSDGSQK